MSGIIYLGTNKINKNNYVGQTWNFEKRIKEHRNDAFNKKRIEYNSHLSRSIRQYGWDNFEWRILFNNIETQEELDYFEKEIIAIYCSWNRNKGYNIQMGGSHGKHSQETKDKISKCTAGKNNAMYGKTGINSPMFGRKLSIETKNKMSISKTKNGKPFDVFKKDTMEYIGTWINQNQSKCSKDLNCSQSKINLCLNSKRYSHQGYIFKYK